MVASYALKNWTLGIRFRLVSGAPNTPMLEGAFDADQGIYACRTAPTNSARKPTFHQLDFRVDRKWTFKVWQLGVYADLQNIYNAGTRKGRSMITAAGARSRSAACRSIQFSGSRGTF